MWEQLRRRLAALDSEAQSVTLLTELVVQAARQATALERLAAALERQNAHQYGELVQGAPDGPLVEISYVDDRQQAELAEIELRLTGARGLPPTEDEILEEYERRHAAEALPGLEGVGGFGR